MTTSNIPDGLSFSDLQKLMANAPADDSPSTDGLYGGRTAEELQEIAIEAIRSSFEQCPDPMVHKVMALMILNRLGEYHEVMAAEQLKDGNTEAAGLCMQDSGVLYNAHRSLLHVELHNEDFTVPKPE